MSRYGNYDRPQRERHQVTVQIVVNKQKFLSNLTENDLFIVKIAIESENQEDINLLISINHYFVNYNSLNIISVYFFISLNLLHHSCVHIALGPLLSILKQQFSNYVCLCRLKHSLIKHEKPLSFVYI